MQSAWPSSVLGKLAGHLVDCMNRCGVACHEVSDGRINQALLFKDPLSSKLVRNDLDDKVAAAAADIGNGPLYSSFDSSLDFQLDGHSASFVSTLTGPVLDVPQLCSGSHLIEGR